MQTNLLRAGAPVVVPQQNDGAWRAEWRELERAVKSVEGLSAAAVYVYGSAASGLKLAAADVDTTVIVPDRKAVDVLKVLANALPDKGFHLLETVYSARVPILRLRGKHADYDLSVNNILPIYNTRLIKEYMSCDYRAARLVVEAKSWAMDAKVTGARCGHLSSYALALMAIYYAQAKNALPVLQGNHAAPEFVEGCNVAFGRPNGCCVHPDAELSFEGFVRFYATEYKWGRECVSVRTGLRLDIEEYPKELKDSVAERPYHSNISGQNAVRSQEIFSEFLRNSEIWSTSNKSYQYFESLFSRVLSLMESFLKRGTYEKRK